MIYLGFDGEDHYLIELGEAFDIIQALEKGVQDSPEYPPGIIFRCNTATYGIRVDGARRLIKALEKEIQVTEGYQHA